MTSIVVPAKHSLIVSVIFESILLVSDRSSNDPENLTYSKSTEEVASSMTKIFDRFNNALARHRSCF
jgi:hypothetical protein